MSINFSLNDEQEQMRAAAREFVEGRELIDLARRRADGEDVLDEAWEELAAMDYTALTVPFDYGGIGDGMIYLAILLEEIGRAALPAPLPETAAFTTPLIASYGGDEQRQEYLPAIAEGRAKWSVALYEAENKEIPASIELEATRIDGKFTLSGRKRLVPYGATADYLVVAVQTGQGTGYESLRPFIVELDSDGVSATRQPSLDRTRPMAKVDFDGAVAEPLGPVDGGGVPLRDAVDRLMLAYCAMMVGAADRVVELSAEHGRTREQYRNPIGMYQAVKHRISDMWMDTQAARSLVYYAAWAVDEESSDKGRAVSTAKAFCGDVMPRVFGDDVQNHGAMGFTTDHDAHIYLKQAKIWRQYLGGPGHHYDRIAAARDL